jgi:hypothetical protein
LEQEEALQRQHQRQARLLPFRLVVVERRRQLQLQLQLLLEDLALVVLPRQLLRLLLRMLLQEQQEVWEVLVWEVPHPHPIPPMPRLGLLLRLPEEELEET